MSSQSDQGQGRFVYENVRACLRIIFARVCLMKPLRAAGTSFGDSIPLRDLARSRSANHDFRLIAYA